MGGARPLHADQEQPLVERHGEDPEQEEAPAIARLDANVGLQQARDGAQQGGEDETEQRQRQRREFQQRPLRNEERAARDEQVEQQRREQERGPRGTHSASLR